VLCALLAWSAAGASQNKSAADVRFAYIEGNAVKLATAAGTVVKSITVNAPVHSFAASPRAEHLALVVSPSGAFGEELRLVRTSGGTATILRTATASSVDLYAEPDFSPSGDRVVYGVATEKRGQASMSFEFGPLTIMDVATKSSAALRQTTLDRFQRFAEPRWSPDATRILANLAGKTSIVNVDGSPNHELDLSTADMPMVRGLDWLGNECVAFGGWRAADAPGTIAASHLRILHVPSGATKPLADVLRMPFIDMPRIVSVEFDGTLVLFEATDRAIVYDRVLNRATATIVVRRQPTEETRRVRLVRTAAADDKTCRDAFR